MSRAAVSLILLYTVAIYAVGISDLVADIDTDSLIGKTDDTEIGDSEYAKVAEESFVLGVKREVSRKFDIEEEKMSVSVYGFEFEKMRAQKINIILFDATSADYRAVEEYVEDCGLGECKAVVSFG